MSSELSRLTRFSLPFTPHPRAARDKLPSVHGQIVPMNATRRNTTYTIRRRYKQALKEYIYPILYFPPSHQYWAGVRLFLLAASCFRDWYTVIEYDLPYPILGRLHHVDPAPRQRVKCLDGDGDLVENRVVCNRGWFSARGHAVVKP